MPCGSCLGNRWCDIYEYAAKLVRVIDGDTVVLDLDLGFHEWRLGQSYRLLRINAPETNTPEGRTAKASLEAFLVNRVLVAATQKSDNFGRYLTELRADTDNVSDWLVANGLAVYKSYT